MNKFGLLGVDFQEHHFLCSLPCSPMRNTLRYCGWWSPLGLGIILSDQIIVLWWGWRGFLTWYRAVESGVIPVARQCDRGTHHCTPPATCLVILQSQLRCRTVKTSQLWISWRLQQTQCFQYFQNHPRMWWTVRRHVQCTVRAPWHVSARLTCLTCLETCVVLCQPVRNTRENVRNPGVETSVDCSVQIVRMR